MINKCFIFLFLFCYSLIYSQEEKAAPVEIFLGIVTNDGVMASNDFTFYLNALSVVYKGILNPDYTATFNQSNNYNNAFWKPPLSNQHQNDWGGFDAGLYQGDPWPYQAIAFGLYKMTTNESDSYFYLDYRDTRYGRYDLFLPPSYGHDADIWIKYNSDEDKFYINSKGDFTYDPITNGQLLSIWDIKRKGSPLPDSFPNYWQNCLVSISNINNRSQLVWGPSPNFSNIQKYKVYRLKGDPSVNIENESLYTWIGETNDQLFDFIDQGVIVDDSYTNTFNYFVKASNTAGNSSRTNIVSTIGRFEWLTSLSITESEGSPRIVWIPYSFSNGNADYYKVERSINTMGGGPTTFSVISTVNETEFTDYDIGVGSPWKVYYRVQAYKSSQQSSYTNTVEIGASGFQKGSELKEVKTISAKVLELHQNFPNPFGKATPSGQSSTNIKFHLPASSVANKLAGVPSTSHITLKVYDIIGREIATLINQEKFAGVHEVTFDASRLASGIYFYQLQAEEFQQTKRMILIK